MYFVRDRNNFIRCDTEAEAESLFIQMRAERLANTDREYSDDVESLCWGQIKGPKEQ